MTSCMSLMLGISAIKHADYATLMKAYEAKLPLKRNEKSVFA